MVIKRKKGDNRGRRKSKANERHSEGKRNRQDRGIEIEKNKK